MCGKALQSLSRPFAQLVYQNFSAPAARWNCREPRRVGHVFLSEPYEALPLVIALTVIFGRDELDSRAETAEPRNGTDIKTYLLSPYDLIVQGCWQDAFLAQLAGAIWEALRDGIQEPRLNNATARGTAAGEVGQ